MRTVDPTAERFAEFLAGAEDDGPIVMINLLRYRAEADYPESFDAAPCSGREAYQRYAAVATQRVAAVGGRLVWLASAGATLIGPEAEGCVGDQVFQAGLYAST